MRRGRRAAIAATMMVLMVSAWADAVETAPAVGPVDVGRWSIAISASPERIGPVEIEVGRVKAGDSRAVSVRIAYRNRSGRTVTFGDTRTSAFATGGTDDQLLAADEGCGWVSDGRGEPIEPGACQAYLDVMTLEGRRSDTREVYATWGLNGMEPLSAGRYEFDRLLRFRVKGGETVRKRLTIAFDVERRP